MNHYEFPLPQEIVELVVFYMSHDIASLSRILSVCRAFAPVARRYLYREITLLDDKNDPERAGRPAHTLPVFSEASFIGLLPSIGHFVKTVRICGSTRCTKQKAYVTSQTATSHFAKAIPCGVHTVWLSEVKFENEAAVDVIFSTCRRLTHLGLNQVSVLCEEGHSGGRIAKRAWSMFFPSAPSIPLNVEPIELRSYARRDDVYLPRLPFTDGESTPYFKLSSVTSLKLYSWGTMPGYWYTLMDNTTSSVQDLMIATALYAVVYRRWLLSCLAENKCLRSLFVVLYDLLPDTPFPDTLQHLTILVCTGIRVAWSEVDVCLDKLPSVSSVEILLLDSFYPLVDFVDFCSSTRTWDFEAAREHASACHSRYPECQAGQGKERMK